MTRNSETLSWAQGEASQAITLWNEGEAETSYVQKQHAREVERAERDVPPGPVVVPFHDPGEAKRQQARQVLERARSQFAAAGDQAADVVGRARDRAPDRSWLDQAAGAAGDAAGAVVNAVASFGNAAVQHPGMLAGLVGGAALTAVSAAGETAGAVLDVTGAGAVAGVPLGAVSTAGIATGVGMMGVAMAGLSLEAAGNDEVEVVDTNDTTEVEETTQDKDDLPASDRRSVESYERLIKEHEEKLDSCERDPEAFDNKGILEKAPNVKVRQRIIDGRVRHLENEIRTFRDNIDKISQGCAMSDLQAQQAGERVELDNDFFWSVPPELAYDVYTQPQQDQLTVGQLSESWSNLARLKDTGGDVPGLRVGMARRRSQSSRPPGPLADLRG